jgi:phytoene dehydrogenase-like protein
VSETRDVVIIGGGHNGLVASFYLSRAGLDVEIVEANDQIGGACVTEELIPGFRFSSCANVVCWLRPEVVADLGLDRRGLEFSSPGERIYHCWEVMVQLFSPERGFVWWGDSEKRKAAISAVSRRDAAAWDEWTAFWTDAGRIFAPFIMRRPPSFAEVIENAAALGLQETLATVMTSSLAELTDRFFESDVLRNHIRAPIDIGSADDSGTGLATALAEAVAEPEGPPPPRGFVRGGMGRLTQAMAEAASEQGTSIRTSARVARIVVEDGVARGVELDGGETISAKVVVSNADPKRTFLTLIDRDQLPAGLEERVANLRTELAPLKLHCAMSDLPEFRAFPGSDLPTRQSLLIHPGRAYWERAWEDAKWGRLPKAPFMEMFTPSTWDDSLAPPGRHTLSFWIQFAPVRLAEGTWPGRREEMADRLFAILDEYAPGFERLVIDRVLLTPHDLEEQKYLTDGNIHHVDVTPSQMLWRRPLPELANYAAPIRNLYLCGAGMHPYGEVTGAPGHNAAQRILVDVSRE